MNEMGPNTTNEQILELVKQIFVENFDPDADDVVWEARLYDDLDIDSIDAVNILVALKKKTGKKLDPDAFKQV